MFGYLSSILLCEHVLLEHVQAHCLCYWSGRLFYAWKERSRPPDPATQLSPNDFCPQFMKGVSKENKVIYTLGQTEDKPVGADPLMLVQFLSDTEILGYVRFSYIANTDTFAVSDVTDDKCVGRGKSDFNVKNGERTEVELRDEKKFQLLMKFDPGTKVLHVDLSEP